MDSDKAKLDGDDAAWLHLDSTVNPMVVNALVDLDEHLSLDDAFGLVEGLVAHERFTSRVDDSCGRPTWRHIERWKRANHVEHVTFVGDDDAELRAFIGRIIATPLDPKLPLWRLYVIDRPDGRSSLLFRTHHALADGYALLGLLHSLADDGELTPPPPIPTGRPGWERLAAVARAGYHLLTLPPDPRTALRTPLSGTKRVAWTKPIALAEVKSLSRRASATVNDVLVAVVTGALRRHFGRQVLARDELHALVPVNLRAPSDMTLGNRFGIVFLGLPVGVAEPLARIAAVHDRMQALKEMSEAVLARGLLRVLGHAPKLLETKAAGFFGKKASLVLTNLRGPDAPLSLAGVRVNRMMFWVPEATDIGLGVSIFSYAGNVGIGILADAAVMAEPELLVADIEAELEATLSAGKLASVA